MNDKSVPQRPQCGHRGTDEVPEQEQDGGRDTRGQKQSDEVRLDQIKDNLMQFRKYFRQLCLAELIQEGDNDNDDKLDFEGSYYSYTTVLSLVLWWTQVNPGWNLIG